MLNLKLPIFCLFALLLSTVLACDKAANTDLFEDNSTQFNLVFRTNSANEQARLAYDMPWSDFSATALYAAPNTTVNIKVTKNSGSGALKLLIGTYSRYQSHENPLEIDLVAGNNSINAGDFGGLMYLRFDAATTLNSSFTVDFVSGFERAPHYILGKTTQENWLTQLEKYNKVPDVVMESKSAMMVCATANAKAWKDTKHDDNLKQIDYILQLENEISGLDNSAPEHEGNKYKLLMTETDIDSAYMFATNHRTAFKSDVAKHAFTNLSRTDGWGVWHELGHMHQQRAWTWDAVGEVTVNIYTLAVQRAFNQSSRLVAEDAWNNMDAFFARSFATRNYNDDNTIDFFTRLCLFEQLRRAFGNNFYVQLHKNTRTNAPNFTTDAEKMKYFMVQASIISGKNLSGFFRKWGFRGVEDGFTEIDALNLPMPTTDYTTIRE